MPKINLPADFAEEWREAYRWYPRSPEMEAFREHVRARHSWSERRPRQLLDWAEAHAIPVFGCQRFLLVMNAGFDTHDRWRSWRTAKVELRRCQAAISRDEESALTYAGNRELLSLSDGRQPRWGRPTGSESAMTGLVYPSLAGPGPQVPEAMPPTRPQPSSPQMPRGQWLTRRA